jgi:type I restriction enzyme S subunit
MINKEGWEKKKLSEIAWYQEGPGVRNSQYTDSGVKLLNVANLQDGSIDLNKSKRYISNEEGCGKYSHFLCDEGDLILASSGIQVDYLEKKMGFVTKEMLPLCMNTSTIRFKIKNDTSAVRFLMYFFKSNEYKTQIRRLITGSAQLNYGPSHLDKVKIFVPSLGAQHQIVAELDALSDIISKKKQQLEELDKLAQATFYDLFGDLFLNDKGWKFVELNKICAEIVDCPHSTPKKSEIPTQFPCIRTSELKKGQIEWKSMQYVDYLEYENRVKRLVPKMGDIVYGREGSYGDAVCLPDSHNFCLGQRTMLFRPKTEIIDSIFLLHTVISEFVYSQAKKKNSGSTVGHVNVSDIKKFSIPIPPLYLQNQFSKRIKSIEKQKTLINQSIGDVQQLFDYTMDKYFN